MHAFMEIKLTLTWLFCILATWVVLLPVNGGATTDQAPSPALDCFNGPLGRLGDCITFVENGSTVSKPEGSCCSGLKSVLKDGPVCLCEALKAGDKDFGTALNFTKALTLPSACGISTPSLSNCSLGGPSPSPIPISPKLNPSVPKPNSPAPASASPPPLIITPASPTPSASAMPPISPTRGSNTRDPIMSPPSSAALTLPNPYMFALVSAAIIMLHALV